MTAEMIDTTVAVEEVARPETMEEIRPENIPLPTDSMITVRLSDAQLHAEPVDMHAAAQDLDKATPGQNSRTSIATSSLSRPSSRSSSRSSQVSSTSNSVDWEGLERTEEQEVKDDATDEVGKGPIYSELWLTSSSQLHYCWQDWNRRTMLSQ